MSRLTARRIWRGLLFSRKRWRIRRRLLASAVSVFAGFLFSDYIGWAISRVAHPGLAPSPEVRQAVAREGHPFRGSIPTLDELAPLVSAVADKRLILLGESSHYTSGYPEIQARVIEAVSRRLGLDAVIYERSTAAMMMVDATLDSLGALGALRRYHSFDARNGAFVEQLTTLRRLRRSGHRIELIGCDPFVLRWWSRANPLDLLVTVLGDTGHPLADTLAVRGPVSIRIMRRLLRKHAHGPSPTTDKITHLFRRVATVLDGLADDRAEHADARRLWQARMIAHALVGECLFSWERDVNKRKALRDSLMAAQVARYLDGPGRGKRAILIAHDGHVIRASSRCRLTMIEGVIQRLLHPRSAPYLYPCMGEWLAHRYGSEMYVVGLFSRVTRKTLRRRLPSLDIRPIPGEMRDVLLPRGEQGVFLDFTAVRDPALVVWLRDEQYLSNLGATEVWLRPVEQFDGVIVVHDVAPMRSPDG